MTCTDCGREKPGECFLSKTSTRCVSCTGRRAGRRHDRVNEYARMLSQRKKAKYRDDLKDYWMTKDRKYVHLPPYVLKVWVDEIRAMLPNLIKNL